MKYRIFIILLLIFMQTSAQTLPFNEAPFWSKTAIWYQIFVERFRNGNPENDPRVEWIQGSYPRKFADDWKITPWNSDWYKDYDKYNSVQDFYNFNIQARRYGGDLQGVLDKIDYIADLGITAVYFNPLNDSPSLHKYDARNFHHIDITFGNDALGDLALMQEENPADARTWQWTNADLLFLKVIREFHKRNIKVVLDYSWNHTGIEFWAWKDILKNGKNSPYADWYEIKQFPDENHKELEYTGWAGVAELPELKKVNVKNRIHGKPYEGNIHPEVKKHIFEVSRRWLDPNGDGDFSDGIDGFRLDVADQIGLDFWREYRKFVRSVNPETLLVGEIWWEKWPDKLMDTKPYLQGDIFDAVMWYQAYKPMRTFFANADGNKGAKQFIDDLMTEYKNIKSEIIPQQMLMSASHDTPRLLTDFYNKVPYKYNLKPTDNTNILTGKPDEETYHRVMNYLFFQFTILGSPQIWAGDEMGMYGTDDPDCRKPLWWDDIQFEKETNNPFIPNTKVKKVKVGFDESWYKSYKMLIKLRKNNPILCFGNIEFLPDSEGDYLHYTRNYNGKKIEVYINNSNKKIKLKQKIVLKSGMMSFGNYKNFGSYLLPFQRILICPLEYSIIPIIVQ